MSGGGRKDGSGGGGKSSRYQPPSDRLNYKSGGGGGGSQDQRGYSGGRHGSMQSLGKIANSHCMPVPVQLQSIKSSSNDVELNTGLVPQGGGGGTGWSNTPREGKDEEDKTAKPDRKEEGWKKPEVIPVRSHGFHDEFPSLNEQERIASKEKEDLKRRQQQQQQDDKVKDSSVSHDHRSQSSHPVRQDVAPHVGGSHSSSYQYHYPPHSHYRDSDHHLSHKSDTHGSSSNPRGSRSSNRHASSRNARSTQRHIPYPPHPPSQSKYPSVDPYNMSYFEDSTFHDSKQRQSTDKYSDGTGRPLDSQPDQRSRWSTEDYEDEGWAGHHEEIDYSKEVVFEDSSDEENDRKKEKSAQPLKTESPPVVKETMDTPHQRPSPDQLYYQQQWPHHHGNYPQKHGEGEIPERRGWSNFPPEREHGTAPPPLVLKKDRSSPPVPRDTPYNETATPPEDHDSVPQSRNIPKKIMIRDLAEGEPDSRGGASHPHHAPTSGKSSNRTDAQVKTAWALVSAPAHVPNLAVGEGDFPNERRPSIEEDTKVYDITERGPISSDKTLYEPEGRTSEEKFRKYHRMSSGDSVAARTSGTGNGKTGPDKPVLTTRPSAASPTDDRVFPDEEPSLRRGGASREKPHPGARRGKGRRNERGSHSSPPPPRERGGREKNHSPQEVRPHPPQENERERRSHYENEERYDDRPPRRGRGRGRGGRSDHLSSSGGGMREESTNDQSSSFKSDHRSTARYHQDEFRMERKPQDESRMERKPQDESRMERKPQDESKMERKPQDESRMERKPQDESRMERKSQNESRMERKSQNESRMERKSQDESRMERKSPNNRMEQKSQYESRMERKPQDESRMERKSQSESRMEQKSQDEARMERKPQVESRMEQKSQNESRMERKPQDESRMERKSQNGSKVGQKSQNADWRFQDESRVVRKSQNESSQAQSKMDQKSQDRSRINRRPQDESREEWKPQHESKMERKSQNDLRVEQKFHDDSRTSQNEARTEQKHGNVTANERKLQNEPRTGRRPRDDSKQEPLYEFKTERKPQNESRQGRQTWADQPVPERKSEHRSNQQLKSDQSGNSTPQSVRRAETETWQKTSSSSRSHNQRLDNQPPAQRWQDTSVSPLPTHEKVPARSGHEGSKLQDTVIRSHSTKTHDVPSKPQETISKPQETVDKPQQAVGKSQDTVSKTQDTVSKTQDTRQPKTDNSNRTGRGQHSASSRGRPHPPSYGRQQRQQRRDSYPSSESEGEEERRHHNRSRGRGGRGRGRGMGHPDKAQDDYGDVRGRGGHHEDNITFPSRTFGRGGPRGGRRGRGRGRRDTPREEQRSFPQYQDLDEINSPSDWDDDDEITDHQKKMAEKNQTRNVKEDVPATNRGGGDALLIAASPLLPTVTKMPGMSGGTPGNRKSDGLLPTPKIFEEMRPFMIGGAGSGREPEVGGASGTSLDNEGFTLVAHKRDKQKDRDKKRRKQDAGSGRRPLDESRNRGGTHGGKPTPDQSGRGWSQSTAPVPPRSKNPPEVWSNVEDRKEVGVSSNEDWGKYGAIGDKPSRGCSTEKNSSQITRDDTAENNYRLFDNTSPAATPFPLKPKSSGELHVLSEAIDSTLVSPGPYSTPKVKPTSSLKTMTHPVGTMSSDASDKKPHPPSTTPSLLIQTEQQDTLLTKSHERKRHGGGRRSQTGDRFYTPPAARTDDSRGQRSSTRPPASSSRNDTKNKVLSSTMGEERTRNQEHCRDDVEDLGDGDSGCQDNKTRHLSSIFGTSANTQQQQQHQRGGGGGAHHHQPPITMATTGDAPTFDACVGIDSAHSSSVKFGTVSYAGALKNRNGVGVACGRNSTESESFRSGLTSQTSSGVSTPSAVTNEEVGVSSKAVAVTTGEAEEDKGDSFSLPDVNLMLTPSGIDRIYSASPRLSPTVGVASTEVSPHISPTSKQQISKSELGVSPALSGAPPIQLPDQSMLERRNSYEGTQEQQSALRGTTPSPPPSSYGPYISTDQQGDRESTANDKEEDNNSTEAKSSLNITAHEFVPYQMTGGNADPISSSPPSSAPPVTIIPTASKPRSVKPSVPTPSAAVPPSQQGSLLNHPPPYLVQMMQQIQQYILNVSQPKRATPTKSNIRFSPQPPMHSMPLPHQGGGPGQLNSTLPLMMSYALPPPPTHPVANYSIKPRGHSDVGVPPPMRPTPYVDRGESLHGNVAPPLHSVVQGAAPTMQGLPTAPPTSLHHAIQPPIYPPAHPPPTHVATPSHIFVQPTLGSSPVTFQQLTPSLPSRGAVFSQTASAHLHSIDPKAQAALRPPLLPTPPNFNLVVGATPPRPVTTPTSMFPPGWSGGRMPSGLPLPGSGPHLMSPDGHPIAMPHQVV